MKLSIWSLNQSYGTQLQQEHWMSRGLGMKFPRLSKEYVEYSQHLVFSSSRFEMFSNTQHSNLVPQSVQLASTFNKSINFSTNFSRWLTLFKLRVQHQKRCTRTYLVIQRVGLHQGPSSRNLGLERALDGPSF